MFSWCWFWDKFSKYYRSLSHQRLSCSNLTDISDQGTNYISRTTLLTIVEEKETPTECPLVCITYHPQNPPIKDILKKNWPTLLIDPKLQCVFNQTPVFGHKRPKNVKDILVCSKLTYPLKDPKPKGWINPSKLCHNNKCRYCPKLDLSGLIKSTTTGRTFIVPSKITCKFNNLIYLITCKHCHSQYVGQTMNSIQMRFQKHLKDVEHYSNWTMAPPSAIAQNQTNVGLHFSQMGHSIHDMQINVLELICLEPNSGTTKPWRESRETF